MKKLILGTLATSLMAISSMSMAQFVAGQDYIVLKKPVPVNDPKRIEVREFFWYGCGHCFMLEPHIQKWLPTTKRDVQFLRTPAAMNPLWEQAARAYYVAEALNVRRTAHLALFHEIHANNNQVLEKDALANFYTRYGVPTAKFNSMYNSFPISSKVAKAKKLAASYELTGVPAVTVNGKYVVQGNNQKVIQVVNYLINKERNMK